MDLLSRTRQTLAALSSLDVVRPVVIAAVHGRLPRTRGGNGLQVSSETVRSMLFVPGIGRLGDGRYSKYLI